MAVSEAGCGGRGGGSYGSPRCWLWVGRGGVLMAVPDTGCGGERRGSHSSPRCWFWSLEAGFSWQSQTLVVLAGKAIPDAGCGGGEAGALMAVLDAGCGVEAGGFHGSLRRWLFGLDLRVLMGVPEAGCGGGAGGGSHHSLRSWL